jgi:hypothetical protein
MKGGQMITLIDGTMQIMEGDMFTPDGSQIKADGTVIAPNGTMRMLAENEALIIDRLATRLMES